MVCRRLPADPRLVACIVCRACQWPVCPVSRSRVPCPDPADPRPVVCRRLCGRPAAGGLPSSACRPVTGGLPSSALSTRGRWSDRRLFPPTRGRWSAVICAVGPRLVVCRRLCCRPVAGGLVGVCSRRPAAGGLPSAVPSARGRWSAVVCVVDRWPVVWSAAACRPGTGGLPKCGAGVGQLSCSGGGRYALSSCGLYVGGGGGDGGIGSYCVRASIGYR